MKWWLLVILVFTLSFQGVVLGETSISVTINATPDYLSFNNTPNIWAIGSVLRNEVRWAHAGNVTPSFPLSPGNCTFTITNNSPVAMDIDVRGEDFNGTGLYKWVMANVTAQDQIRLRVGLNGTASEASMLNLLSSAWQELASNLASTDSTKWEAVFSSPSLITQNDSLSGKIYLSGRTVS